MPKKKTTLDETTVDTVETETVDTPTEETLPTTADELSPMVVALQNEINALKATEQVSRAEFVATTDKQLAKIKELNDTLASLQDKVDAANALIAQMPDLQKAYSDARNQTTQVFADAAQATADAQKIQTQVNLDRANVDDLKSLNDATTSNLSLLAQALQTRSDDLDAREKAIGWLKSALGIK